MTSKEFIGPTCGAVRAAKIIMDNKKAIATEYGRKSVIGLADLIDRESGLRELLEVCEAAAVLIDLGCTCQKHVPGRCAICLCQDKLRAAIAKCLPRG